MVAGEGSGEREFSRVGLSVADSKPRGFEGVSKIRRTMESADVLYGVTLDADGTSKVLSMRLE